MLPLVPTIANWYDPGVSDVRVTNVNVELQGTMQLGGENAHVSEDEGKPAPAEKLTVGLPET